MAALLYASRLNDCPYEIVLVASNKPDAAGLALAKAEGVRTFAQPHQGMSRPEHDAVMEQAAADAGAQYIVLAGYMRILSEEFVTRWAGKIVNIHPSLLPKYKGLDTHQRAIEAGDSHGGATVHLVTPELDSGAILEQVQVVIQAGDSPVGLAERVKLAEHQLYPRALSAFVSQHHNPDFLFSKVRDLALALPETHERESHGSPGFRVGTEKSGKYFAHFNDQHHGSEHIAVLVKTGSMDELLNLVETQPDSYFKPASYGASGWVGLILNRPDVDWDHVSEWLERSWQSVAPARLTKLMNVADEF